MNNLISYGLFRVCKNNILRKYVVMKEIKIEVEEILKKAIANGGKVSYSNTKFSEAMYKRQYLADVNSELLRFGKLHQRSKDETWYEFEINRNGRLFVENGGFEGERKYKLQKKTDLELDRNSKKATIHGAATAFHTLNVSIIAGVTALIALLLPVIYERLSFVAQEYVIVLLIVFFLVATFFLFREASAARKGLIKDNQD